MIRIFSVEFYWIAIFLLFFLGGTYQGDLIEIIDISSAIKIHAVSILSFAFGCVIFYLSHQISRRKIENDFVLKTYLITPNRTFYILSLIATLAGLVVAIAQIAAIDSDFSFFQRFGSFENMYGNRLDFIKGVEDGGIPGIIRMLANMPLGVFLMLTSFAYFFEIDKDHKSVYLKFSLLILALALTKISISLDRNSLIAIALALSFFWTKVKTKRKVYIILGFLIFFTLLEITSRIRLEGHGFFDFLKLYFYLGLANLQLLFVSFDNHTLGLNTIFGPLTFIGRFFNFDISDELNFNWIWNPAQYGIGYLWMDFGYFFPFILIFFGFFSAMLTNSAYKRNIDSVSVFFVILYGLATMVVVPMFRGLEFYVALLTAYSIPRISKIVYVSRVSLR